MTTVYLVTVLAQRFGRKRDAFKLTIKDEFFIYVSSKFADNHSSATDPDFLALKYQPITRTHKFAKPDVFQATKPDHF